MNHVERLERLKTILEKIPDGGFNLGSWISGIYDEEVKAEDVFGHCGATVCAVGWACLDPLLQEEGLKFQTRLSMFGDSKTLIPKFEGECGWEAVNEFFGLDMQVSEILFTEEYYEEYFDHDHEVYLIPPSAVIKRLDIVIENFEKTQNHILKILKEKENV